MTQGWKKAVSVMLCAAMILSMSSVMISADELNQPTTGVEQTQPENENTNETPEKNKENTDNNTTEGETPNTENEQTSEAVKNVIAQLEALPKLDDLTEATDTQALKNQVESAKAAFDALTEEEKASISEELKGNLADLDIFVSNFIVNTPTAIPEEENNIVADQDNIMTLEEVDLEGQGTKEAPYQIKETGDFVKALESTEATIYMQLEANITDTLTVPAGKSVVLNLNGYTLTNKDGQHTINNEGTLTVNGTGTVDNVSHGRAAVYNAQNATVTLNGGTFTRSKENGQNAENSGGNSYYTLQNLGNMTIYNGVSVNQGADQAGRFSSLIANGWYNGNQNTSKKEANLTINGGDISGGLNTVKNDDYGNLVINGGTIHNSAQATIMNCNKATIIGGTFSSDKTVIINRHLDDNMDKGELTITGGTFTAGEGKDVINVSSKEGVGTISISNATMNGNLSLVGTPGKVTINNTKIDGEIQISKDNVVVIDKSTITGTITGEGAANVIITDSTVAGQPVTNSKPFEVVGGGKYATLAEAIQNVKDGGTIKLLADVPNAEGIAVQGENNFTLDFNNHTYTLKTPGAGSPNTQTNGFQFLQGSTITLKNGTIRISEDNKPLSGKDPIMRIIQNYADLTLENMQIYAKNQYGGEDYPLSFNNGNIHFKGNTSIYTSSDNNIAFDVDNFSAYPSAIVTFDEDYTGTINGRIVYDGENKDTHKIIIKGNGTFGKIDAAADVNDAAAKDGAIEIHGGSFAESVEEYVVDYLNYELHSYDGRYTYYHTLEEAKDAAQGVGGVITDVDTGNVVVTVKPDDSKPSKPSKPSNGGSSNSGSSNSGSSNSGTTVDKEEEDYNEFWDKVIDRINKADDGDTVTVHAGNYDKMPNKVMKALEKNGVGLIIKYNGGEIEIPAGEAVNKSNKLFWSFKELGNYVFATEDNDEQNNDKQDNEQNNGSENNTQSNTQTEQKPFGTVETKPNPQTGSEDYVGLAAALAVTAGVAAIGLGKKKKDEE